MKHPARTNLTIEYFHENFLKMLRIYWYLRCRQHFTQLSTGAKYRCNPCAAHVIQNVNTHTYTHTHRTQYALYRAQRISYSFRNSSIISMKLTCVSVTPKDFIYVNMSRARNNVISSDNLYFSQMCIFYTQIISMWQLTTLELWLLIYMFNIDNMRIKVNCTNKKQVLLMKD